MPPLKEVAKMFFVVSNEGNDTLVNLNTGLAIGICDVPADDEDETAGYQEIVWLDHQKGRKLKLRADKETIFRFRELVRKTKEKE
jgi:hypothetical protein